MSAMPEPLQAQLVATRRNQILDAATRIFAQRGFHNSTIRQIASEAGVADGTIYIYFKNKTDLLLGLLNRLNESESRSQQLEQILHSDVRHRFVAYLRQRLTVIEANLQTFRAILPEILADEELRTLYRTQVIEPTFTVAQPFVEEAIAGGLLRPLASSFVMRMISSTVLGMLVLRLLGDSGVEEQWQQLPEFLAGLLFTNHLLTNPEKSVNVEKFVGTEKKA